MTNAAPPTEMSLRRQVSSLSGRMKRPGRLNAKRGYRRLSGPLCSDASGPRGCDGAKLLNMSQSCDGAASATAAVREPDSNAYKEALFRSQICRGGP